MGAGVGGAGIGAGGVPGVTGQGGRPFSAAQAFAYGSSGAAEGGGGNASGAGGGPSGGSSPGVGESGEASGPLGAYGGPTGIQVGGNYGGSEQAGSDTAISAAGGIPFGGGGGAAPVYVRVPGGALAINPAALAPIQSRYQQVLAQQAAARAALANLHQPSTPPPTSGGGVSPGAGQGGGVAPPPTLPPPPVSPPPIVTQPGIPPTVPPLVPPGPTVPPIVIQPVAPPPVVTPPIVSQPSSPPVVVQPSQAPPAINLMSVPPSSLNNQALMTQLIANELAQPGITNIAQTPPQPGTMAVPNSSEICNFLNSVAAQFENHLSAEERIAVTLFTAACRGAVGAGSGIQQLVNGVLMIPQHIGQGIASAVNKLTNLMSGQPASSPAIVPPATQLTPTAQPTHFFVPQPTTPASPAVPIVAQPPYSSATYTPPGYGPPPLEIQPSAPIRLAPSPNGARPPGVPSLPSQPVISRPPVPGTPTTPAPQGSADCTTPTSALGELARQLWNCPTFQQQLKDKLTVTQEPGKPPTLGFKEPVCLCCDSAEDLRLYAMSGGVNGSCVMTQGIGAQELEQTLISNAEGVYGG